MGNSAETQALPSRIELTHFVLSPRKAQTVLLLGQTIEWDSTNEKSAPPENFYSIESAVAARQGDWQTALNALKQIKTISAFTDTCQELLVTLTEPQVAPKRQLSQKQQLEIYRNILNAFTSSTTLVFSEPLEFFVHSADAYNRIMRKSTIDRALKEEVEYWASMHGWKFSSSWNIESYDKLGWALRLSQRGYMRKYIPDPQHFFTTVMAESHDFDDMRKSHFNAVGLVPLIEAYEAPNKLDELILRYQEAATVFARLAILTQVCIEAVTTRHPQANQFLDDYVKLLGNSSENSMLFDQRHHQVLHLLNVLCRQQYSPLYVRRVAMAFLTPVEESYFSLSLKVEIRHTVLLETVQSALYSDTSKILAGAVLKDLEQLLEEAWTKSSFHRDVTILTKIVSNLARINFPVANDVFPRLLNTKLSFSTTEDESASVKVNICYYWLKAGYEQEAIQYASEHFSANYLKVFFLLISNNQQLETNQPIKNDVSRELVIESVHLTPFLGRKAQEIGAKSQQELHIPETIDFLPYLIARAAYGSSSQVKRQSLKRVEELLPSCTTEQLDTALASMRDCWQYTLTCTVLFRRINHKKEKDYRFQLPETTQYLTILEFLIKLENSKAASMLEQLSANYSLAEQDPQQHLQIIDTLFQTKVWSPQLRAELVRRSQQSEISPRYIKVLMYLTHFHNTRLTIETLNLIEPDPKAKLESYELILRIKDLFAAYEALPKPLSPMISGHLSQSHPEATHGLYLATSGQYRYGHLGSYKFDQFQKLLQLTNQFDIDVVSLRQLKTYLQKVGLANKAETIMANLETGLHPFAPDMSLMSHEFQVITDLHFETSLVSKQITELLQHSKVPATTISACVDSDGGFSIQKAFSLLQLRLEKSKFATDIPNYFEMNWKQLFFSHLANGVPQLMQDEISILFEQLESLNNRKVKESNKTKSLRISFIEKGNELLRFLRATDVVRCCVNSSEAAYVPYMARRAISPTALTFDVTDTETGVIVGNVETRLGINAETQALELCCVGIYSAYKNKAMIEEVLGFIERSLAQPLRLAAINIASIYGGKISKPLWYSPVPTDEEKLFLEPLLDVVYAQNQLPVTWGGDDIGQLKNGPVEFKGYRKELPWVLF